MNQSQAKEWLPLIQALAEGKTIQRVASDGTMFGSKWFDVNGRFIFDLNLPTSCFRIKPEPKKVKVSIALHKDETFGIYRYELVKSDTVADHARVEQSSSFVKWLDHLEYELPEGEA